MGAEGAIIGIDAGTQIGGAFLENSARSAQTDFDTRQLELQAQIADDNAKFVKRQGEKKIEALRRSTSKLKGAQRASLASQGIDIESGSALDIQEETEQLFALDELTIRNNAMREAFGFESEATSLRGSADFQRLATEQANFSTILTAGLGATSGAFRSAQKFGAFKSNPNSSPKQLPNNPQTGRQESTVPRFGRRF